MKKFLVVFFFPLILVANPWYFEAKGSYFRPESGDAKKIYGEGWPHLELDASYALAHWCEIWGSVGCMFNNGRSLGAHEKANIWIVPLTVGFRYVYHFDHLDVYAGIGPRYFFYHEHAHSHWVKSNVNKSGIGGAAVAGARFEFLTHGFFDLFVDYGYKKFHFNGSKPFIQGHNVVIGGWSVGIGIGYKL